MARRMPNRGRRRGDDNTDSFPALTAGDAVDETAADDAGGDDAAAAASETSATRDAPVKRSGDAVVARLPRISAAIAGGLLLCLSFPPFGWWYLAVVAFSLLAWVLTRDTTKLVGGLGYGFLFGAAFYIPLLPWTGEMVGVMPWLALSLVEAVFPALFGLCAVAVRRLTGWPIWFAGLWAVFEWAKSTIPFGGFPWGVVGFGQSGGPLLSLAQIGGAPLVSFAVTLLGFGLAALAMEIFDWWRSGRDRRPESAPPAVVLPGACVCLVLIAIAAISPAVRHSGAGAVDEPSVNVAAVQGNVPRLGLDFNAQRREVLDNHVRETMRLADDVRAGRAPQPLFVIWPENSSDIDPLANRDAADQIAVAVDASKAPILVGGVLAAPGYTRDNPVSTNSVVVWNPETGPGDRHDKQIVQPFGEYLPWRSFFSHFSDYADRAGYFQPGSGNGIVEAAGVPIGVSTCWEVIFDRSPRESVLNGAQVLTVPSNNATFNESMSVQQLAFGRLRAVEHNRFVIVAGTTGISAVISPDGRVLASTQFFEPAYLDMAIRLKTQLTPATRWAPLVQGLLVAVGIGALIAAILHNGRFVRGRRRVTDAVGHDTPPDEGGTERGTS
ncbi:apolipoprotein N-acyltransferase [Mycobacterium sp. ITM-2016-00318]|uniref:apolipoprotein N-acyltransferase n=1 Tax=Mycobacterium sp. ITM-2016-00318 TaxID=2099693 RepID=UPI002690827D|nr:apolipoprotein N-acyltransferase [Mycobacterium sp. ITM-2016-00318]WNG90931.1 apolipoprotein N-acyltransferase [Mycobacterium sp. ITM-2016-00318]